MPTQSCAKEFLVLAMGQRADIDQDDVEFPGQKVEAGGDLPWRDRTRRRLADRQDRQAVGERLDHDFFQRQAAAECFFPADLGHEAQALGQLWVAPVGIDHHDFPALPLEFSGGGREERGDAFAAGTACQAEDLAARCGDRQQAVGHLFNGDRGLQLVVNAGQTTRSTCSIGRQGVLAGSWAIAVAWTGVDAGDDG